MLDSPGNQQFSIHVIFLTMKVKADDVNFSLFRFFSVYIESLVFYAVAPDRWGKAKMMMMINAV